MAIHSLRQPVQSHRALARRKKMLALGIVLAILVVAGLVLLFVD